MAAGCLLVFSAATPVLVAPSAPVRAALTGPDAERKQEMLGRLQRAAAFILAQQDENGAMNESGLINTDSNMLYAMMGLLAAYDLTGQREYLRAVERGCRWLMQVQNKEGDWYLAYRRQGSGYVPALPDSYSNFAAIRGVDTTSALFVHVACELQKRTDDPGLRRQLREAARRAYRFLITRNRDPVDGLYWNSFQLEKGRQGDPGQLTAYRRFSVKYASDNAETYLGLVAAARLFGDQSAKRHAERLKQSFVRFFDPNEGVYAVMLDAKGNRAMHPSYARHFATGWSVYLFADPAMGEQALAKMAQKIKADGSFADEGGPYALSTLAFLLGECRSRTPSVKTIPAQQFLFRLQQANGGIADDVKSGNTYVNIAGIFLIYLCEILRDAREAKSENFPLDFI